MNPRALNVKCKNHYILIITFANKEVKQFDVSAYLNYPVYEPLKDESFFRKVKVSDGIIQWDDYIDFDPDTLYLESKPFSF